MPSRTGAKSDLKATSAETSSARAGDSIQDLGNGLRLRHALHSDTEALAAFHRELHYESATGNPDEGVAVFIRDLMSGSHPTFLPEDFVLVEDTNTGRIVSSMCWIRQTWTYGGITFGVGRPEIVSTHPDYRRRGLVRAQFETMHRWSAQQGESLQVIAGIPWYYRQFGYEMALSLGGGRLGFQSQVPKLKDGQPEPYHVRLATLDDVAFIAQTYERGCGRSLVSCVRDAHVWQYELEGRSERNVDRRVLCVVETPEGEPTGFLAHKPALWRGRSAATAFELKPDVSWLAVSPTVIRYLWARGEEYARRDEKQALKSFAFLLGTEHPVYEAMRALLPEPARPYAWYLRVPDLAGFLRRIAPVLERRLASSFLAGHTGEIKISRYRDGFRLLFEHGRLAGVDAWQPTSAEEGSAAFPDLTFLQLLFGYRSLEELKYAFADCWTQNEEARVLLEVLFPKEPSSVWGLM